MLQTSITWADGCAWSPDGSLLAVSTSDSDDPTDDDPKHPFISILCTKTGQEVSRLVDRWYGKSSLIAWSPDGQRIASHSRVWTVASGTFEGLKFMNQECGVSWSPDGKTLSVCNDGANAACLQHALDLTDAGYVRGPVIFLECALWSPDSRHMALVSDRGICVNAVVLEEFCGDPENQVVLWFHEYNEKGEEESLQAAAWTSDGLGVLTYCSKAGHITTRDAFDGSVLSTVNTSSWDSKFSCINVAAQFSPDRRKLAYIDFDNVKNMTVRVVQVDTGKLVAEFAEERRQGTYVCESDVGKNESEESEDKGDDEFAPFRFLEWSPDSTRLALFAQKTLRIWSVE